MLLELIGFHWEFVTVLRGSFFSVGVVLAYRYKSVEFLYDHFLVDAVSGVSYCFLDAPLIVCRSVFQAFLCTCGVSFTAQIVCGMLSLFSGWT